MQAPWLAVSRNSRIAISIERAVIVLCCFRLVPFQVSACQGSCVDCKLARQILSMGFETGTMITLWAYAIQLLRLVLVFVIYF